MNGQPFRGSWNRLPFARRNAITASWLLEQRRWYRARIPPEARRILWLHLSDHIGDSLMRLSSIILLQGRQVDLLASAKAVELFEEGGAFQRIFCLNRDDAASAGNSYDLVILDALQTKPLMAKQRLFRMTPFVTQNDYFHYCRDDYNLTLFSWYRMAHLLGREGERLERQARLVMECGRVSPGLFEELGIKDGAVGIALGGREDYRIYHAWDLVVRLLLQEHPGLPLVLLGTENADALAKKIMAEQPLAEIVNCVDRLTLKESAAVLAGCRLLLCADGGLLHVASAVGTPSVGLFAQEFADLRYVPADRFRALRSEEDVKAIDPEQVAREACLALQGQWQAWHVEARA